MTRTLRKPTVPPALLCLFLTALPAQGQVHHHANGAPWNHAAEKSPDAEAGGWCYNLGITGLRAVLMKDRPMRRENDVPTFDGASRSGCLDTWGRLATNRKEVPTEQGFRRFSCDPGEFNIDATINAADIVMGLLLQRRRHREDDRRLAS